MMEKQVERGLIVGIRLKQACMVIHHMFFVDDSIFFLKVTVEESRNFKSTLEQYYEASWNS